LPNNVIFVVVRGVEFEDARSKFRTLGDFLDHIELGIREMVRVMIETYAQDEFLRYIGAKRYERTPTRGDYRSGSRNKTLRPVLMSLRICASPEAGSPESATAPFFVYFLSTSGKFCSIALTSLSLTVDLRS